MNRKNKISFERIQGAVSSYQSSVTEALLHFRQADAQAKEDSKQYVDAEGRYQAQRTELVNTARQSIESAKELFNKTVKTEIGELSKELGSHTMNRPSPALLDNLRTFRDFNLQPSKSDISAMLEMAGGNTLGLRAINSVLKATKSPLRVVFPDTETFEKDLEALEKLTDESAVWTPIDFHHEGCAIYGGQPRPNYPGSTWGNTSLTIARAAYESQLKGLSDMSGRWVNDIIPSIAQVKELYKDSEDAAEQYIADRQATGASATVEPNKAEAIEHAETMARQRTEADNRAREVLSNYQK